MNNQQTKKERNSGTFGHTLEMPALPSNAPDLFATAGKPRWRLIILAAAVSFLLGITLRYALDDAVRKGYSWQWSKGLPTPTQIQINVSSDIRTDLGRHVNVPLLVHDILPFMIRNNQPKYIVLGSYVLKDGISADKKQPVMVVVPAQHAGGINEEQKLLVTGLVAMDGETEWITESLSAEQQDDLRYISKRVNYWDRVVILAESLRTYTEP